MNTNTTASIRARLLSRAKSEGTEFQLYLVRYACERFLYRLGASGARDQCILKGDESPSRMDGGALQGHS